MIKKFLLAVLASLLVAFTTVAQTNVADSFMVDGIYRSYRLHIPGAFSSPTRALVLNMHGFTSNAIQQEVYSGMDAVADTAGFYAVYPQGTYSGGVAFWNIDYPGTPNVNDVKFLSVLIDTLAKRYAVDRSRVYATGFSNGGYMSHVLGLRLNNKIAAIASVSGTMVNSVFASGNPGRAVPAMQIHGTADGTVIYNGDGTSVSVDSVVRFWVRNNACNATPTMTAVPNTNTSDGCSADRFVWNGGNNGTTVELYRVNGGAHTWPGAPPVVGVTNQDFSASREIWRFFSQYRLPAATSIGSNGTAAIQLRISPNPVNDNLVVDATGKGLIIIRDVTGKVVLQSSQKTLDVSSLVPGYFSLEYVDGIDKVTASFVKE